MQDNEAAALEGLAELGAAAVEDQGIFSSVSAAELEREEGERPPTWDSPEWDAYAMSFFAPHELDREGHPRVHGLRRAVGLLVGPILESVVAPAQCPTVEWVVAAEGREAVPTWMRPAVCTHLARVRLDGPGVPPAERGNEVVYQEAADAHPLNNKGIAAAYPTAMAGTRAEARNWRKLLRIKAVSAEECGLVPETNHTTVTASQRNFLKVLGERTGVNVGLLIADGRKKHGYGAVNDMPYEVAAKLCEVVSGYQRSMEDIPERYRGYDSKWETEE